jgi:hypothetical protein
MIAYKQTESAGYKPYFYEAGLYLWKPLTASTSQKLYKEISGEYDFTSDLTRGSAGYRPQTIEQVIQKGYLAVANAAPETALLTDKQRTFWQGLDDIIRQVRRRYEICEENIYQIEKGVCYALSRLYQVEAHRGGVPADSKERYKLSKQLQELYQEEREEKVSLWQDISKLKLSLPEAAQQYLAAHRKVSILNDQKSELN